MLRENKILERDESYVTFKTSAARESVVEAARLEGISFEEALRRRREFRYLT